VKSLAAVILLTALARPAAAEPRFHELREIHYQMGTLLDITLWHQEPEAGKNLLRQSVQEAHRLDRILSNYDPTSALSSLNRHAGGGEMQIDNDLFQLLTLARDYSTKSAGYFDVTVGPLVALWQRADDDNRQPNVQKLAETLALVGISKLRLYEGGEAELTRAGMAVDFGGIGKGYAVDKMVEILRKASVKTALINFGRSSVYALGAPPGKQHWAITVTGPDERPIGTIYLKDQALSTSQSMGRYWTIAGKKYGHLINPKTGFPLTTERSATVIMPTATAAEALTKPLVLLGKKGLSLMKGFPRAQFLLMSENRELSFSPRFAQETHFQPIETP
jgi:thiamine biosynthesis lipoprotein